METIDVDSYEYVEKDERMARRLKRRAWCTPDSQFNNTLKKKRKLADNELDNEIDEDYYSYLNFGENPNEDIDPQYKIFLENLREDGKSYILEVVSPDGTSTLVKYEEECELDDEVELQVGRESGDFLDLETIEARENVSDVSGIEMIEAQENLSDVSGLEKIEAQGNVSDVLDIEKIEAQENVSDVSDIEKIEGQENASGVADKDELRTRESCGNVVGKDEMESPKRGLVNGRVGVGERYRESFKGEVDECYKEFCCGVEEEGDSFFLVSENGERVYYEDTVVDSSSDVEIIEMESTPNNPFVTSVAFDSSVLGNPSESNHSQFREGLLGFLRRPFAKEEHEELLRTIKEEKPVGRILDLRSGSRSYHASNSFKSYLDHYDDLKRKIDGARFDKWKELTLLRGFFYWLKHLTTEGAFRPWLDSTCLEVLPENR